MHGVNYLLLTPTTFLERSARVFPDRTTIIDGFLNDLPKPSTGKIQKYLLKEMEWKGANRGTV